MEIITDVEITKWRNSQIGNKVSNLTNNKNSKKRATVKALMEEEHVKRRDGGYSQVFQFKK